MNIPLFALQGQVWLDRAAGKPMESNDVLVVKNIANQVTDRDTLGKDGGIIGHDGWFSLTLEDLEGCRAAAVGDYLEFAIYSSVDHSKKLCDLERYQITAKDIEFGGVLLDFDVARKTS